MPPTTWVDLKPVILSERSHTDMWHDSIHRHNGGMGIEVRTVVASDRNILQLTVVEVTLGHAFVTTH